MGKKIRGFDTEMAFGEMTSVRTLADVDVAAWMWHILYELVQRRRRSLQNNNEN
jgi:hypothetical protein